MSRCRVGVSVGPLGALLIGLFLAVMIVGALYYIAIIGLIVGAVLGAVKLWRWAERDR